MDGIPVLTVMLDTDDHGKEFFYATGIMLHNTVLLQLNNVASLTLFISSAINPDY